MSDEPDPPLGPFGRRVLCLLLERGPMSLEDLVAAVGSDATSVVEALERMVNAGLLGVDGSGGRIPARRPRKSRAKARR